MKARIASADADARVRREVLRADFDQVPSDACAWAHTDDFPARDTLADALRSAVAHALTARQRDIVEWHFFEGLSQGAIARRLGVTQQVVQKALYGDTRRGRPVGGALRRLREALTPTLAASP
jgi:DNA-directed RNA polymerase specialized sigma24 family protein